MIDNINTQDLLRKGTNKTEAQLEAEFEAAAQRMKTELVEVYIPEAYRGAFGNPCKFSVNGVRIEIPIGERKKVPKPHAEHLELLMRGAVVHKGQKRLAPDELYKQ